MVTREREARDLFLSVERSRPVSLGRQVEEGLRQAIRSGLFAAGSRLPSTRALSADLAISRGVVVRAYEQLAAEGYIDLRHGRSPHVRGAGGEPVVGAVDGAGAARKPRFDLRPHVPDVTLFPRQAWSRAQRQALASAVVADLGYVDHAGLERLRREIAAYVGRARGVATTPEHVVVTSGTTHSLSLICRVLARRGGREIAFESPSHKLLHAVAARAGLEPVGIPVDREGLVVSGLAASAASAVVVAPAHQFPSGCALSGARRADLIRWAIESECIVVEDEYDAEFRYDRAPVNALHALAPEHVVYLGSTGKTLAPAIRLGWAILPSDLRREVREELALSMLQISGLAQLTFADFLERGEFDRHLRRMRTTYKRRRDLFLAALHDRIPGLVVGGLAAGLHLVVELDSFELETSLCALARARGVSLESLSEHTLPGYTGPPGLLIGYGGIGEATIPAAVEALAEAFAEAAAANPNTAGGAVA